MGANYSHTLDPNIEIPEDAPPAMSHNADEASKVREASEAHREQVQAEAKARAEAAAAGEPEPGSPGRPEDAESEDAPSNGSEVPDGTVDDVLAWVGDDKARAQAALDAEQQRPTPRTSLVAELEKRLESTA